MPVNCESWSITTNEKSRSAVSASSWGYPDPRCTTSPSLCLNPPWGSWPGSMRCIWRIQPLEAVGWFSIWPEKGSRSAVTVSETSCAAWVYGPSTRSHAPRCQVTHRSAFPAWWTSRRSRKWIRFGQQILPISHCGRASSTWWPLWICSPGMFSAGNFPTALTWNSAWRPWKLLLPLGESHRSSTPIRGVRVDSTGRRNTGLEKEHKGL